MPQAPPTRTADPQLPPRYDALSVEREVEAVWEAEKCFHAEPTDPGEPYAVVIPPPNVTGALHLGHALNNTIQDVLVRRARMAGRNAVWIPGTDHAGIATQSVVDKRLQEAGEPSLKDYKRQGDAGREAFLRKVHAWKDEYEARILGQLRAMGCSCDWDRTAFTMDKKRAAAVGEAFTRLFKDGLIYRGKRLVNWDPATQTALADDEVEMEEVDGQFYYLRYPVVDAQSDDREEGGSGLDPMTDPLPDGRGSRFITVATTRPETMLGDTAVAINPRDPRAASLRGRFVRLPIVDRLVPIVEDDYVVMPDPQGDDPKAKYATGFLKVTPAHDPNDWDIGRRHDLGVINVMAPDASISDAHGWTPETDAARPFVGLSREDARKRVVAWFKEHDLLEDVRPYRHSVGHSYRSHVAVEPYLSDQWYVAVKKPIPWLADEGVVEGTDVPRNSLAGLALTALEESNPESDASPDRKGGGSGLGPETDPLPYGRGSHETLTYLITFTTYGTWLPGRDQGAADRKEHNIPGEPYLVGDEDEERRNFERLKHPPVVLNEASRHVVQKSILDVCRHRGWTPHALHVRSNHLHCVVSAGVSPQKVMNDLKSYATRALREADLAGKDQKIWTRHGSTRYLKTSEGFDAAARYTLGAQGKPLLPAPFDERVQNYSSKPVSPDCKGGGPDLSAMSDPLPRGRGSQALRFVPERYARTFQFWHENIRDWCISRQLWWGHRIPVWTDADARHHLLPAGGATQDPDVLDTWFSSALWPMSTLGWPNRTADLEKWNPTAVLCTAREIITLWVSRMVMFNRYLLAHPDEHQQSTTHHSSLTNPHFSPVPFHDVFIHAMIQDGEGRKMSKSLGNGVDPLDIIATHGADAMRFTLAAMTTQTQDVRMPVERDPATGRNTSPRFDFGRNFCNKLWNASRFVIGNLTSPDRKGGVLPSHPNPRSTPEPLPYGRGSQVIDRWILSRLARTISQADAALAEYRFDRYANACYDFFWRDFCDWYVEATKPVLREGGVAADRTRQVLATCLDVSLRLLHPAVPFATERLWWALNDAMPERGVAGLPCPPAARCVRATWPSADGGPIDDDAENRIERVRELVVAIRNVRGEYKIEPRRVMELVVVHDGSLSADDLQLVALWSTTRLGAHGPDAAEPPAAARTVAAGCDLYLAGLVNADADGARLAKERADLGKKIATLRGRLGNTGYTDKAPAHLVRQTRDDLAAAEAALAALGD